MFSLRGHIPVLSNADLMTFSVKEAVNASTTTCWMILLGLSLLCTCCAVCSRFISARIRLKVANGTSSSGCMTCVMCAGSNKGWMLFSSNVTMESGDR